MENSDFTLKLNEIPVIDNHCHPPLKASIETESEFKRFFTESFDPRIVSSHVQNTLFYSQSLRDINAMLGRGGEPNIEAILTERNLLGTAGLVRRIVQRAHIGGMIVDFGYQADDSHSVDDSVRPRVYQPESEGGRGPQKHHRLPVWSGHSADH